MIRPRQLVFRGRVMAQGLLVRRALIGEEHARQRVLEQVREGVQVHEISAGYLVRWPEPRAVRAEELPGGIVVSRSDLWLALPLRDDEVKSLAPASGSFVHAEGGRVHVVLPSELRGVDLADWIDVGPLEVLDVEPVVKQGGFPVASGPRVAADEAPNNAREALGAALPPNSREVQRLIDALAESKPQAGRAAGTIDALGGRTPGVMDSVATWLARVLGPSSSRALVSGSNAAGSPVTVSTSASRSSEPGRLHKLLARWVGASPLSALIGHRQARYVEKTLRMFEQGRFDEALRHAIPFSSIPGAVSPPSMRVPSPRAELRLTAATRGLPQSSLNLGDSLYDRFRRLYREAARALESDGRIEEAAYVLFDLLGDNDKGIALLERHERYGLAARMAEGKGMPPGQVIRLWFLAKDPAAAVRVARRTGAFADAISRLEAKHPDLADRLRVLWADRLASAGDFVAAIDAVWPVTSARRLAHRWIDLAIEFGGPPAMRMLPRKLELRIDEPSAVSEVGREISALLDRDDDDARVLRSQLGQAWLEMKQPWPPVARGLGRALARRLCDDGHHRQFDPVARKFVDALRDPLLSLDSPMVRMPTSNETTGVHASRFTRHERGLHRISDAARLANGRLLVAMGDAGVRVVDARGKVLRRYEHPAQRLVVSDTGTRAIGVFTRGAVHTLTRFDLVTGRAERWCDANFVSYVDSYDGATWFVATEDALTAVDAQSPGFDALWRVGQIRDPIVALARDPQHVVLVVHRDEASLMEVWRYELTDKGPVLRERSDLALPRQGELMSFEASAAPSGRAVMRVDYPSATEWKPDVVAFGPSKTTLQANDPPAGTYVTSSDRNFLWITTAEDVQLRLLAPGSLSAFRGKTVRLEGSTHSRVRVEGERLLVCDDLGRIVHLNHELRVLDYWLV
ncbi:MAG: bpX6 domain-containing protein [Myxococcota bacterium]